MPTPRRHACREDAARGGVTLAELLVVIFLTTVLLACGVARFGRHAAIISEGERAARLLAADLRMAQSLAIAEATNHCVVFSDGGRKFTAYAVHRVEGGGVEQVGPTRVLPDTVAITGSAARAEFAPGGDALSAYTYRVTSPGARYTIRVVLATGSVALEEAQS